MPLLSVASRYACFNKSSGHFLFLICGKMPVKLVVARRYAQPYTLRSTGIVIFFSLQPAHSAHSHAYALLLLFSDVFPFSCTNKTDRQTLKTIKQLMQVYFTELYFPFWRCKSAD